MIRAYTHTHQYKNAWGLNTNEHTYTHTDGKGEHTYNARPLIYTIIHMGNTHAYTKEGQAYTKTQIYQHVYMHTHVNTHPQ